MFDDPSYDKTSFIDDIVPSLLVYNIPPPDDDFNDDDTSLLAFISYTPISMS